MANDLDLTNPELAAAQQLLIQREKLADMLTQRGMQGIQTGMQGTPVSPLQGLAQLANAYVGAKLRKQTEAGSVDLAKRYGDWLDTGARDYLAAAPYAKPNLTYPGEANPAETTDPMERIRAGLVSRNPLVARLAQADLNRQNMFDKPIEVNPGNTAYFPGGQRPNFTAGPLHAIPADWRKTLPAGATVNPNDPPGVFRMKGSDGVEDPYQLEFEGGQVKGAKRLDNAADPNRVNRAPYFSWIAGQNGVLYRADHREGKLTPAELPGAAAAPGQPPNPPVPAVGGKYDPVTARNVAGAQQAGHVTGDAVAKANLNLQQIQQETERGLALIDRMVGKEQGTPQEMKPHPGFESYVGATLKPGFRFIHGTPESDFDAILKQELGQAFLKAYDTLRGTGQITEKEGQEAKSALTRMSKSVSEREFHQAANDFRKVLRQNLQNAQTRANTPLTTGGAPAAGSVIKYDAQGNRIP